ncbi:MAG: hypothetical protein ACRDKX_04170 [Solirubrobacterales bacterium]
MSTTESGSPEPLACPNCARKYPLSERFCADCEMPLVYVGRGEEEPITEAHEKARKVKPQYLGGDLVKAGFAGNLAEAELIQGILLEEGIPSVQRRTRGFDVPDFLAAGPRDILVPQAAEETARGLLADVEIAAGGEAPAAIAPEGGAERPLRLLLVLLVAVALAAALVFGLYQLAS